MRREATRALYEGSLAEPGDRNPYAGRSLVLAKLWMRGYRRMLSVRINSGPAMTRHRQAHREVRGGALEWPDRSP
ncbi:ribosome modulation factor [Mycobacterium intracellulare]|uniref:ribosome modulation factor n=1 Tax=Mycobacterium intracellulare TaxID=1767 RepID=UPI003FD8AF8F